ncbi:L-lactate dehydrogenase [Candidatus Mycoplasma haematominutum]|uniref:L-lactate dehydrogenase n=1 Tax=Candidatus Mycoplasma haematominutum 'Birmingham 1' TaxID=1116213 RepID=G8C2T5_9MOLU|nr:L-lactate dehydrogenase [Candidatus Mycoplasma haematominutum]CCE66633.1 L-lactate dehydrogenase [Candidatus Mycoplasma haematominutum 'Birmingham 1']
MAVKIAVIGCGAVGSSFLYSAIHQDLAAEYGLIDYNEEFAKGQALDLEDSALYFDASPKLKVIKHYQELDNYDFIVITAGRPQKEGETRLEMIKDNAKIMKKIAEDVRDSAFQGIVVICSNPVDVLTYVFQKVSGFKHRRVIGSGTVLDSSRLKVEISRELGVSPSSLEGAFVIGEHGDSSLVTFSNIKVAGLTINRCEDNHFPNSTFCCSDYEEKLEKVVSHKAYEIINRKRATHYGIGAALAQILKAIIFDKQEVLPVSVLLNGEYGLSGVVIGAPAIVGKTGIEKVLELKLSQKEMEKLHSSAKILSSNFEIIRELI